MDKSVGQKPEGHRGRAARGRDGFQLGKQARRGMRAGERHQEVRSPAQLPSLPCGRDAAQRPFGGCRQRGRSSASAGLEVARGGLQPAVLRLRDGHIQKQLYQRLFLICQSYIFLVEYRICLYLLKS